MNHTEIVKIPTIDIKRENFKRLINPRIAKAIKAIDVLSHLADANNYTYTDEESIQVQDIILAAAGKCSERFQKRGKTTVATLRFAEDNN